MSVVIAGYNGARFMRPMLTSLAAQTTPPAQIVIVDNASADDTAAIVEREFPHVDLIRLSRNEGFGAANNIGIQRALDSGADHVLLLNQDIIAEPPMLERLVEQLEANAEYGFLSAFQLTYEGDAVDPMFKGYATDAFWSDVYFGREQPVYEARVLPAAAILVRREVFEQVGGFDPLFFMYREDDDLCRRMRAAGWKLGFVPRAAVQHWHGNYSHKRTWSRRSNLVYSDAVLRLKESKRTMPMALLALIKYWLRWPALAVHTASFFRCVRNAGRINRHRKEVPFAFRTGGGGTGVSPVESTSSVVR